MTHERCSELLGPYVRAELPPDGVAEVRAHLDGCDECRAEERALVALSAAPAPLDDVERARLHRALTQELFVAPANADVVAPSGGARRAWIGPAMGAAAVLVALGFVGLQTLTGGGGDAATGRSVEVGAPAPEDDAFDGADPDAGGGGSGAVSDSLQAGEHEAAAKSGDVERATSLYSTGPQPEFDHDAGSRDSDDLSETGRSGRIFTSFASAYAVEDAGALARTFAGRLAEAAGAAGDEVRECAGTMPPDASVVPAYGALAEYDGRDALVLGFVASESGKRFDRYVIWVWERGECEQPIDTLIGDIDS